MAIECVALPLRSSKGRKSPITKVCSLVGCGKLARSNSAAACEMHYYRNRKTGNYDDKVYALRWMTTDGYIVVPTRAGYPTNGKNLSGRSYEHRVVLHDAIGPGGHPCNWCGKTVRWDVAKGPDKLVVDHLDAVKSNNDRKNLVPSCQPCNAQRGLFVGWVIRHRADPFLRQLFDQFCPAE